MLEIPIEMLIDLLNNLDINDYIKIFVVNKLYKKYVYLYLKYKNNKIIIYFLYFYDYIFMLS
jgi:hypothetical protein